MAGVLLTQPLPIRRNAGGLVRLGEPKTLGRLVRQALEHASLRRQTCWGWNTILCLIAHPAFGHAARSLQRLDATRNR